MADSLTKVYVGQEAAGFISASLLSGETLAKGNITLLPNVAFKVNLKSFDLSASSVVDATCDFTDAGDITYIEKSLAPDNFGLNKQMCKKDWLSTYAGASMRVGTDGTLPANFQEYIIGHAGALVGQENEKSIWAGATGNSGEFDGFEVLAAADANVIDVAKVAISAVNVTSELNRVVSAIPQAVYGDESLSIMVSTSIYQSYISSLGGFGATGGSNATEGIDGKRQMWYNGSQPLFFLGIPVVHCPGLTATDMFAARKEDLVFGSSLYSELLQCSILDMSTIDGSQNSRVILRGSAAVAIVQPEQVVFYS